MRRKLGRPKIPAAEKRFPAFPVRVNCEEEKIIREAIANSGQSQSDWLRAALLEKAQRSEGSKRGDTPIAG